MPTTGQPHTVLIEYTNQVGEPRQRVNRIDAAAIVPLRYTPQRGLEVYLVRQWRVPVRQWLWEIPAGTMDVPGETPMECARRELTEETGYTAEVCNLLTVEYATPGWATETVTIFVAWGLTEGYRRLEDDERGMTGAWFVLDEALDMTDREVSDAKTELALLKVAAGRRGFLLAIAASEL